MPNDMGNAMLEVVDANNRIAGRAPREQIHRRGLWHRTSHVWLILEEPGALVFQLRSANKDIASGLFDVSVGGHVDAGEDADAAAVRELEEELGLAVSVDDLTPLGVRQTAGLFGDLTDCEFQALFALGYAGSLEDIRPSVEEVSALISIGIEEGLSLFSGETTEVTVPAWVPDEDGAWQMGTRDVDEGGFVPSNDAYHYRAFVMARRFLAAEDHLVL